MKLKERVQGIRVACTKEKIKEQAKHWGRFFLNPRLLLCLFIAWMITNGWSYLMFGVGMLMKINWMRVVGATYMGMLWLPFTPEKIITVLLAIALMRLIYPRDRHTLGVLRKKLASLKRKRTIQ